MPTTPVVLNDIHSRLNQTAVRELVQPGRSRRSRPPYGGRPRFACIVFNLHVDHDPAGIAKAQRDFRWIIDRALARGGSFYLTYHRWATREQVLAAYPQLPDFLRAKLALDPAERFQSEWWRHVRDRVCVCTAAAPAVS